MASDAAESRRGDRSEGQILPGFVAPLSPESKLNTNLAAGPADLADRAAASTTAAATTKAAASNTAAKSTGSGAATTAAKSDAKGTTMPTASVSVPQNAPDGGFSMITPAQTAPTYAKIGAAVTFVWNYTSVLVPPPAVDVIASNSDGVWTIASNMSVKETSVVWNTSNEATPLPMESYTFVIYDSEAGVTAVPSPGHLSPYIGYQFAMYKPQEYVPSNGELRWVQAEGQC